MDGRKVVEENGYWVALEAQLLLGDGPYSADEPTTHLFEMDVAQENYREQGAASCQLTFWDSIVICKRNEWAIEQAWLCFCASPSLTW